MRMLAQILEWEDRLARNMLPGKLLSESLQKILGDAVDHTVATGHTLATGRSNARDQIFPLLDMIDCMHDPYVLPSMKKAFRSQTMSHLKHRFLQLLSKLCETCEECVKAFSASVGSDFGQTVKDVPSLTTVAGPTAFAMRVLKVLFTHTAAIKGRVCISSYPSSAPEWCRAPRQHRSTRMHSGTFRWC
jgi:hypothetical protein